MGTVNLVIAKASGSIDLFNGTPVAAQNVTSSGTAAASTIAAVQTGDIVRIATDTAIYAKTGPTPTAAAGSDWYIPAGSSLHLVLETGDKVSVIDA